MSTNNPTKKRKITIPTPKPPPPPPQVVADDNVDDEFMFSLKTMLNKEKTKILFLESDSDFADILLSFLTMPLGRIVKILQNYYETPTLGSLITLQKGLANLNHVYFEKKSGKHMLLNPISPSEEEYRKLKLNIYDAQPTKYFTCSDWDCKKNKTPCLTMYNSDSQLCLYCLKPLTTEIGKFRGNEMRGFDDGVFTRRTASLLITDDLQMMPNEPGSFIRILESAGVTDITGLEQGLVTVGFHEMMELVQLSLFSGTPLTDYFLNDHLSSPSAISPQGSLLNQSEINTSSSSKKIIVKAMIQKSTNKLLFIQAKEDFVDFLFSFLTIPLGGVVRILGGKTSLGSVDNLYNSIEKLDCDKHLKTPRSKEALLNPLLAPTYGTVNQILPLFEMNCTLYYYPRNVKRTEFVSHSPKLYTDPSKIHVENGSLMRLVDTKGGRPGGYVKGPPNVFLITDDLTVVPLCMTYGLSLINRLKIPLSDVGELEIDIGLEEASSILKASLTSTFALSNGLHSILQKRPKQEHEG